MPGRFPDNVVSVAAPNSSTLVLHLNASYDPEWFLYNQLSQLVPMPLAWHRTSLFFQVDSSGDDAEKLGVKGLGKNRIHHDGLTSRLGRRTG